MATVWGQQFSQDEILQRVGDMRQLAGAELFELVDGNQRGVRGARLYNAAGLDFDVIPDRGMGITRLAWKGMPLAMMTPVGVAHPAYGEPLGLGWLNTWPAGFLTTCGLTQVGSPAQDGDESLGQHGKVANLPAGQVHAGAAWVDGDYVVWVEGEVREAVFFGDNLSLHRRVWTRLGENRLWIDDRVTNHNFTPCEHMYLQHFNLGFPLVSAHTRLELPPGVCTPRDAAAAPGVGQFGAFEDPQAGYHEQVFYHDLEADAQGNVRVRLENPSLGQHGVSVTWVYPKREYPILVEWKMMGQGQYVVGVEPANCHVEGRVSERARGTLQSLAPLETREYHLEVIFEG